MNAKREELWAEYKRAGAALKGFPKSAVGLTPDAVKATPEWQNAKKACDQAFANLRAFNSKQSA